MTIEAKIFFNDQTSHYVCSSGESEQWNREDGLEVELNDYGVNQLKVERYPLMGEFKIKFDEQGEAKGLLVRDGRRDGKVSGSYSLSGFGDVFTYKIEHKLD